MKRRFDGPRYWRGPWATLVVWLFLSSTAVSQAAPDRLPGQAALDQDSATQQEAAVGTEPDKSGGPATGENPSNGAPRAPGASDESEADSAVSDRPEPAGSQPKRNAPTGNDPTGNAPTGNDPTANDSTGGMATRAAATPVGSESVPPNTAPNAERPERDQSPTPYLLTPDPRKPVRELELGATAGFTFRSTAENSIRGVEYGPGRSIGGFARIRIAQRWHIRVRADQEWLPLSLPSTEPYTEVARGQSDLKGIHIAARVEPTWHLVGPLAGWVGLGLGWGRFVAEPYASSEGLRSGPRSGVFLEVPFCAGLSAELLQDWLILSLHGQWAPLVQQTGDLFGDTQAIGRDGQLDLAPRLPKFASSSELTLSLGLLL